MSCPKCGSQAIHACTGAPMEPWTQKEIDDFNAALARYETAPPTEAARTMSTRKLRLISLLVAALIIGAGTFVVSMVLFGGVENSLMHAIHNSVGVICLTYTANSMMPSIRKFIRMAA